jgi:glycosyltransferase involved in cell wall biosynthesis
VSEARRIAFCITDLDPGGAERALVQLVTRLPAADWTCKVFCLGPEAELSETLRQRGIAVECLDVSRRRPWKALNRLTVALREWRPVLLQTFLHHANLLGRLAAWRANVPVTISGLRVAERDAPWRLRADRWTQRLVTMNVCVSQGVADFAVREIGLDPRKVRVIPNGVDAEHYSAAAPADLTQYGIPAGARTILFAGRLHPQKAPDLLIAAAAPLLAEDPGLHLLIVGEGPLKAELIAQVERLGLAQRVHFAGRLPDLAPVLRAASVLVLPSRWEGMPNVVLEAMAAGCPVVGTDVEGTRELIRPGETGRLCKVNSVNDLRQAMAESLREPASAATMDSSAQHIVRKRFTWNSVADEYVRLYRELV